jgi:uncharacterized protein YcbX
MDGRVTGLWRYPVKSMGGEPLPRADIGTGGIRGDRAFAVVDRASGRVLSAKREARLLLASARLAAEDEAVLTLPDGAVSSDDPGVDEALSAWLDRDVRLARPVEGERATIEAEDDEEFQSPAGRFFDSRSTLHLLTSASLRAAAGLHDGDWDVHRFRPNVLVALEGEEFVEEGWGEVLLGSARARVRTPTNRCVLTTHEQAFLPRDRDLLRALRAGNDGNLGVYLDPVEPGMVIVGDVVRSAG